MVYLLQGIRTICNYSSAQLTILYIICHEIYSLPKAFDASLLHTSSYNLYLSRL
jgi:hypothetical protein